MHSHAQAPSTSAAQAPVQEAGDVDLVRVGHLAHLGSRSLVLHDEGDVVRAHGGGGAYDAHIQQVGPALAQVTVQLLPGPGLLPAGWRHDRRRIVLHSDGGGSASPSPQNMIPGSCACPVRVPNKAHARCAWFCAVRPVSAAGGSVDGEGCWCARQQHYKAAVWRLGSGGSSTLPLHLHTCLQPSFMKHVDEHVRAML